MDAVKCPLCGHMETNADLEKGRGWFLCSACNMRVAWVKDMHLKRVPTLEEYLKSQGRDLESCPSVAQMMGCGGC